MFAFEVAVTLVGAPGVVAGVVAVDGFEMTLVPAAFIATILNEYAVPLMRPLIVQDVAVVVLHTTAAVVASVIVYPVMSAPLVAGAVQVNVIEPFPKLGVNAVIFDGAVAGTTLFEIAMSLRPASVIATTLNVYAVPFVSRLTTQVVSPAVVQVRVLPEVVTKYPVIGNPPVLVGAVHEIVD